ncbi:hypothetical protein MIMGU_mgv1a016845mg [Erythranthe guttata]|uniref:Uncharacterized protein n=1 Tax=Erythranthe guttata TaxID=4155 RepID=A0A022RLU0_ERYGU|nr:hypothetical protein MIMGU_mgv1a016845mg [Erythranthe guttata]
MSETAITRSPDLTIPRALSSEKSLVEVAFPCRREKLKRKGIKTPFKGLKRLRTEVVVVNAKIGQSGLHRDRRDAMWPLVVYTKIASTSKLLAAIYEIPIQHLKL